MSLAVAEPAPHVLQLRRKKVPQELSLPEDYVAPDYTSLPPEPPQKKRNPLRFLILLLILLLGGGAIAYGVVFGGDEAPANTPIPQTQLEIDQADMIVSGGQLVTRISATTNAPEGTEVQAELLENGAPFAFWDPSATTSAVAGGQVRFEIPEAEEHEAGRRSAAYDVQLSVPGPGGESSVFTATLSVPAAAEERFYNGGTAEAEATPTIAVTPTISETTPVTDTPAPTAEPTPEPLPAGPLDNIAVSRQGVAFTDPYNQALAVGQVNPGDIVRIVAKLGIGTDTWYLIPVPIAGGASGWINSNLIDLPPGDVNRIPTVQGTAPFAVTFSGGNIRSAPVTGDVVVVADAGRNVRVQGKLSDESWFLVDLEGASGWISGGLLTMDPQVRAQTPVVNP